MPEITDLEKRVIEIARESFVANGIINSQMKDIASRAGISRSSLYRHFPSTMSIAFYVLNDVLDYLIIIDKNIPDALSGFEQFSFYMRWTVDRLCNNLDLVRFIKEFDTLYNLRSNYTKPPDAFYRNLSDYSKYKFISYLEKGIRDGSIKPCENIESTAWTFYFVALSMTEHIMLREDNYLLEHGKSKEFIENAIELMLNGIKA